MQSFCPLLPSPVLTPHLLLLQSAVCVGWWWQKAGELK